MVKETTTHTRGDDLATTYIGWGCDAVKNAVDEADTLSPKTAINRHLAALDELEFSLDMSARFKRLPKEEVLERAVSLLASSYKS